jgi:hypothetical protein
MDVHQLYYALSSFCTSVLLTNVGQMTSLHGSVLFRLDTLRRLHLLVDLLYEVMQP